MGSGFAFDGIGRERYNRNLKQMRRARYNKMKEAISKFKSKYHQFNEHKKLSELELKNYKRKIKASIIIDRQISFIKTVILTALIAFSIIYISKFLFNLFASTFGGN